MILQRSCEYFRCACAALVDQHHDRIFGLGPGGRRHVVFALTHFATLGVDDDPFAQPSVRNFYGLIEQATGVVPQIDHQAFDQRGGVIALAFGRVLLHQLADFIEGFAHLFVGPFLKRTHAQIAVSGVEQFCLDALDLHDITHHRKGTRRFEVGAKNMNRDFTSAGATHQVNGFE